MSNTALELVKIQAEDEGLWFNAVTATESYLQGALRVLHDVIEAQAKEDETDG